MLPLLVLPFFLASMIADVIVRHKDNNALAALFQPLTTFFVILMALLGFLDGGHRDGLAVGVTIGLVLSFAADMILVDRDDSGAFLKGMVLFFAALLVYAATLAATGGFQVQALWSAPFLLAYLAILMKVLWKGLGKLRLPVMLYGLAFVVVVFLAVSACFAPDARLMPAILMAVGAVLFMLGDSQLAAYHFVSKDFPMLLAPAFYFLGQCLIALGTVL